VWSGPAQIESELARTSDHIEMVIQKYRRGTYRTIEEHDVDAGEVAEPYPFPVIVDAPASSTGAAIRRLVAIAEHGCGVYPVVVVDPTRETPYGADLGPLMARPMSSTGPRTVACGLGDAEFAAWTWAPEGPPDVPAPERIGDHLRCAPAGTRSRLRSTGTVLVRTLQSRISGFTVALVKILQIAPALHGAKMQTTEGTSPVVVWALIEDDDGSRDVVGLSVGGKGDRTLVPPDPRTFESYNQTG